MSKPQKTLYYDLAVCELTEALLSTLRSYLATFPTLLTSFSTVNKEQGKAMMRQYRIASIQIADTVSKADELNVLLCRALQTADKEQNTLKTERLIQCLNAYEAWRVRMLSLLEDTEKHNMEEALCEHPHTLQRRIIQMQEATDQWKGQVLHEDISSFS